MAEGQISFALSRVWLQTELDDTKLPIKAKFVIFQAF